MKKQIGEEKRGSLMVDFFSFVFFLFSDLLTSAWISELKKGANIQREAADWSWNVLFFFSSAAEKLVYKNKRSVPRLAEK